MEFSQYIIFREESESPMDQPHVVSANPPFKIPKELERLADAFKKSKEVEIGKEVDKAGGEKAVTLKSKKIYLVDDAVRCLLLGQTPSHYEIVTDAHPDEVERIARQANMRVINKNPKQGVVKLKIDGQEFEVHTMRKEPKNGKNDKTTFTADPKEDSLGRDLTVNSIYYDIIGKKIIDHHGGLRHIKDGVVKFTSKDALSHDGMRKFKALRVANTLPNGKFDPDTEKAIKSHKHNEDEMPPDQIRHEFLKAITSLHTNVAKVLKSYQDMGLLSVVFPGLELDQNFPDCKTCKTPAIVLASLLKNNKPAKLVKVLKELRYTDREIKDAVYLINLLIFNPDYIYDYKREILSTSLTRRQMLDWAKMNSLDKNTIEKLIDYRFSVNHQELVDQGISADELPDRVRSLEADNFKKHLSS